MFDKLNTPIRYLKGIGPKRAAAFADIGINSIEDLLYFFPKRYEDRTNFFPISKIKEGQFFTVRGEVMARGAHQSFYRRRFKITEVVIGDATGKVFCVWFNQPYLKDYFKPGRKVVLYGKVEKYGSKLQMNSPEFEFLDEEKQDDSLNMGRIVPVYKLISGISQRGMRKLMKLVLDTHVTKMKDFLSYDIRSRNALLNLARALINIHFPQSLDIQKQAYQRLSFEEFFLFQMPIVLRKLRRKKEKGIAHVIEGTLVDSFLSSLPFKLTEAQKKTISEIKTDMANSSVMQRLLQGDVGSGKTVVATILALCAIQGGYQTVFMVPTEILAKQHYEKISSQFTMFSSSQLKEIRVALLTSSLSSKAKTILYQELSDGKIDLLIGTHALLEQGVVFKNLGLLVIDEQHKFGVAQRSLLTLKGAKPDVLIMTATPIPRTLAITMYADLDISVINELPPGRLPVETIYYTLREQSRAYKVARSHIEKGNQVYIVYPVIEDSYLLDIQGAKQMYETLRNSEFKDCRVGLIHGRMKQKEQDEIMAKFRNKQLDVLVSTTVLEVGIDVPGATCMIIEHAERFGLSQLHQLRGRVGRGKDKAVCILISDTDTPQAKARVEAMVKYSDGFRIAEQDLKIRGPGEFFGQRQHGLTELKIGNPLAQMQLLKAARDEAIKLLRNDPELRDQNNALVKEKLLQRFPEYEKFINVG